VNQRDQEAWLLALATRVDEGQPVDWAAAEREVDGEGRDVVRSLRIVAEIAEQGRRATETVQSPLVTDPTPTPPILSADDEPVSDRYRSYTPSEPAEIKRKLLFGVALVLSIASVLAGLLGWGRLLQYGLAGLALLTVFVALATGAAGRPRSSSDPGPTA
jgi:hypothetical protein